MSKAKPKAKSTSRASKPRKPTTKSKSKSTPSAPPARLIDQRIRDLGGWRGQTLARMRALILDADPATIEEWKWSNPVWSHPAVGIICTGEAYKQTVKLTFARGAALPDPSRLFNSSLAGNTRRAIDIREGEAVDAAAFKALIKAAVAANGSEAKRTKSRARTVNTKPAAAAVKKVKLLSGGNPQIAKADGDAPIQAYLAALPDGWKRDLGRRLDALIVRTLPDVRKAVKWNSPMYGVAGGGYFLGLHSFTKYLKIAFFRGAALRPPPPGASKDKNTRYLDIFEGDELDEAQFASWVKQAAALPGEWSTK